MEILQFKILHELIIDPELLALLKAFKTLLRLNMKDKILNYRKSY